MCAFRANAEEAEEAAGALVGARVTFNTLIPAVTFATRAVPYAT